MKEIRIVVLKDGEVFLRDPQGSYFFLEESLVEKGKTLTLIGPMPIQDKGRTTDDWFVESQSQLGISFVELRAMTDACQIKII